MVAFLLDFKALDFCFGVRVHFLKKLLLQNRNLSPSWRIWFMMVWSLV